MPVKKTMRAAKSKLNKLITKSMNQDSRKKIVIGAICLAIFILLFVIFMYPVRSYVAKSYLKKADNHYTQQNWPQAKKYYEKSLYWNIKGSQQTYTRLAVSDYNVADYNAALEKYILAAKTATGSEQIFVFNNIGNTLRQRSEYDQALGFYSLAIEMMKIDIKKLLVKEPFINKIATLVYSNKCQEAKDEASKILADYKPYFSQQDFNNLLKACEKK